MGRREPNRMVPTHLLQRLRLASTEIERIAAVQAIDRAVGLVVMSPAKVEGPVGLERFMTAFFPKDVGEEVVASNETTKQWIKARWEKKSSRGASVFRVWLFDEKSRLVDETVVNEWDDVVGSALAWVGGP